MRVSILTFGCKVNQYESEYMAERLEEAGFVVVPPMSEAEVYIVNSCAVTHTAERKVQSALRRIRRENPRAKIVLAGCYPQLSPNDSKDLADLILGNSEKKRIVEFLKENGIFVDKAYWLRDGEIERVKAGYGDMSRAYVKVEDGCDRSCTYCAIRFARGTRIRSKPIGMVTEEVRKLVDNGYREIVITGINLGRYGVDTGERLYDLVKAISDIEGDFRIRLSSMNPEDVDESVISMFRDFERLVPHLHLSLQSGSDRILRMMGRMYTTGDFLKIVESLRKIDRLFSITTDIIVGFPGESEADFKKTLEVVEEVEFSRVHAFRYSPRKGTPAAKMRDQIPGNVKRDRITELESLAKKVAKNYRSKLVGKRLKVLVERTSSGISIGHDEYYVVHEFSGGEEGKITEVIALSVSEEGVVSKVASRCKRKAI